MTNTHSIAVRNVGKDYKIYGSPMDRMRELLPGQRQPLHQVFRALDGVSFEIQQGETIGLIGPNGSGKSTLLEILCGTLTPSEGEVDVKGRIAALLELGAGFNPEFSGRENVYLNAAILGIDKEYVDSKFSEVCEFADIGDYVDRPVKTYSSGMYVRLAFAAAINMDPEILIVDEALSVGDIAFQRKCYRYFQDLQRRGVTIIFVTHAMELIRSHCHKALYLDHGKLVMTGSPRDVVHAYLNKTFTRPEDDLISQQQKQKGFFEDYCPSKNSYNSSEYRWGNRIAEIIDYEIICGEEHNPVSIERGSRVDLEVTVQSHESIDNLIYGMTVKSVDGITVFGANTRARELKIEPLQALSKAIVKFTFDVNMIAAEYFISLGVAQDDDSVDNLAIDRRYDLIHLTVSGGPDDFGIADLNLDISVA
ncbi:MAG: lipopolysaccharide transport system ATP-binding protein [Gammaproteobacteria bacterium]|jgi:lipopolysaccharide transport system ATP-binding protein